jgi:hypothetical protein
MDLHIDLGDGTGLTSSIYTGILDAVLDGRLRPGDRLPSTRQLSDRAGRRPQHRHRRLRAAHCRGVADLPRGRRHVRGDPATATGAIPERSCRRRGGRYAGVFRPREPRATRTSVGGAARRRTTGLRHPLTPVPPGHPDVAGAPQRAAGLDPRSRRRRDRGRLRQRVPVRGSTLEPLQQLDADGRVIYVGSFSKTMLPSLRLGFLVAPASLRFGPANGQGAVGQPRRPSGRWRGSSTRESSHVTSAGRPASTAAVATPSSPWSVSGSATGSRSCPPAPGCTSAPGSSPMRSSISTRSWPGHAPPAFTSSHWRGTWCGSHSRYGDDTLQTYSGTPHRGGRVSRTTGPARW